MVAGSDVVFTFAYRKPHSAMISVLQGEIPCSCARNSLFRRNNSLFCCVGNLAESL
jgi:hypothetical protein